MAAAITVVAGICLAFAVTFRLFDTDLWMHLTRARAALALGGIPDRQLWTWPLYGGPDVGNAAWGFAFLVWPFWKLGGVFGLFVWRWAMALGTFALAWSTVRWMGARTLAAIVVLLACVMIYRPRSQVRPETLAALLLALQIWILERRRSGGRDLALLLIPLAWIWLAAHASFWVSWLVCGIFALDEWRKRRHAEGKRRIPLAVIGLLMAATAIWNPLAGKTLELPVQFLALRSEPLYQAIGELKPIDWVINWMNGLPLLMAGWPLLQVLRWRKGRGDVVEALLCAAFTVWAMSAQRFLTFWAVVAAPYLARDVAEWLGERRWFAGLAPAARAAAAAALCVAITALEIFRSGFPLGIAIRPDFFPIAASDFIERAGVRGRAFNYFEHGGYLLWRFWPDRERLPFMTTAPELATPQMRLEYQRAMVFGDDWRRMDQRHRFDWVLLKRDVPAEDRFLDFLDRDERFALVFLDDQFALYVRREGVMAEVAGRHAFRWLPASQAKLDEVAPRLAGDPAERSQFRADLERAIAASPYHARAGVTLASLEIAEGRWQEADRALEDARRIEPGLPGYEERRAAIDAALGRSPGTRP
jgi:hypothetical protein